MPQEQHERLRLERLLSSAREAEQRLQRAQALPQRAAEESDTKGQYSLQPRTPSRRGSSFASSSGASATGPWHRASMAAPQSQRLSPDALEAELAAAVAARARAPDLAAVREAAVLRRRNLQRQLTSISTVRTLGTRSSLSVFLAKLELPCIIGESHICWQRYTQLTWRSQMWQ